MDEDTSPVKKPVRTRKTVKTAEAESTAESVSTSPRATPPNLNESFSNLIDQIKRSYQEFESLQKEIEKTRKLWVDEQEENEVTLSRRSQQQEIERQREQETYQYNLNLTRKRAEDEFADRKSAWEKELAGKKEQLEKDRLELEDLRKQVTEFEPQINRAVKQAEDALRSSLTGEFEAEKKLREQEVKSEKEILGLKIEGLSAEAKRQSEEITVLKRSLDQAQAQVKDIAVKVIEGGTSKIQATQDDREKVK